MVLCRMQGKFCCIPSRKQYLPNQNDTTELQKVPLSTIKGNWNLIAMCITSIIAVEFHQLHEYLSI